MSWGAMICIACITGLSTMVGGLLSYCLPVNRNACLAVILGFAAGIMLGLSLFGLLPQAYLFSGSLLLAALGFLGGVLLMVVLSRIMRGRDDVEEGNYLHLGLFIAVGIALHNLPEGLALGSGFQGNTALGFMITAALLLHNIPEGIAVGAPLARAGVRFTAILGLTAAAGLMTPVGAAIGWAIADISYSAMGFSMGLAAGAMVYIGCHELLYEGNSLRRAWCSGGVFAGIIVTFLLG